MTSEPLHLPVIPLRDVVIFPGVKTVISAGRAGTLKAIQKAAKGGEKLVFAVSQRENVDDAAPETLHTIGTVARIGQLQRFAGGVQLLLEGEERGIAMRIADKGDHMEAVVRPAEEMWPADHRGSGVPGASARGARAGGRAGAKGGPAAGDRERDPRWARQCGSALRPGGQSSRIAHDRQADAARDSVGRRPPAARPGPCAAADLGDRRPVGHQVASAAGARRSTARDGLARAVEGDSAGAWRG